MLVISFECMWVQLNCLLSFHYIFRNTKITTTVEECTASTCVPLGLYTPEFPGRGVFTANTPEVEPYCCQLHPFILSVTLFLFDLRPSNLDQMSSKTLITIFDNIIYLCSLIFKQNLYLNGWTDFHLKLLIRI